MAVLLLLDPLQCLACCILGPSLSAAPLLCACPWGRWEQHTHICRHTTHHSLSASSNPKHSPPQRNNNSLIQVSSQCLPVNQDPGILTLPADHQPRSPPHIKAAATGILKPSSPAPGLTRLHCQSLAEKVVATFSHHKRLEAAQRDLPIIQHQRGSKLCRGCMPDVMGAPAAAASTTASGP